MNKTKLPASFAKQNVFGPIANVDNVSRRHLHAQSDLLALDETLNLCDWCLLTFLGVLINTETHLFQGAGLVAIL